MVSELLQALEMDCPICRYYHTQFRVPAETLPELKRLPNGFIHTTFNAKEIPKVYPFFLDFWTCPNCYYTDVPHHFSRIKEIDEFTEQVRIKFYELYRNPDTVYQQLTDFLKYHTELKIDRVQIHLHIYLYVLNQLPESSAAEFFIGKIYLRLGWIYQLKSNALHLTSDVNINVHHLFREKFDPLLHTFRRFQNEQHSFKTGMINVLHANMNDENIAHIKTFYNSIKAYNLFIDKICKQISDENKKLLEHNSSFKENEEEHRAEATNTDLLISSVQRLWNNLSTTESSCILRANTHFIKAINLGYFKGNLIAETPFHKAIIYGYETYANHKQISDFIDQALSAQFEQFKIRKTELEALKNKQNQLEKRLMIVQSEEYLESSDILKESLSELKAYIYKISEDMNLIKKYSSQLKRRQKEAQTEILKQDAQEMKALVVTQKWEDQDPLHLKHKLTKHGFAQPSIEYYLTLDETATKHTNDKLQGFLKFLKGS